MQFTLHKLDGFDNRDHKHAKAQSNQILGHIDRGESECAGDRRNFA